MYKKLAIAMVISTLTGTAFSAVPTSSAVISNLDNSHDMQITYKIAGADWGHEPAWGAEKTITIKAGAYQSLSVPNEQVYVTVLSATEKDTGAQSDYRWTLQNGHGMPAPVLREDCSENSSFDYPTGKNNKNPIIELAPMGNTIICKTAHYFGKI